MENKSKSDDKKDFLTSNTENLNSENLRHLIKFIELNSEQSRWSNAITLLISITVASLIALLGAFVKVESGFKFFHDETDQKAQPVMSKNDSLSLLLSLLYNNGIKNSDNKLNTTYQPTSVNVDSISFVVFLPDTTTVCYMSKNIEYKIERSEKKINDSILSETIFILPQCSDFDSVYPKFNTTFFLCKKQLFNKKNNTNSDNKEQRRFSAFELLFTCTSLLGLLFTLFFYILRRTVDRQISNLNDEINQEQFHDMYDDLFKAIEQMFAHIFASLRKSRQQNFIKEDKYDQFKQRVKQEQIEIYEQIQSLKKNERTKEEEIDVEKIKKLLDEIYDDIHNMNEFDRNKYAQIKIELDKIKRIASNLSR